MRFLFWLLAVTTLFLAPAAAAQDTGLLFSIDNRKFPLTLEFYGEWVGPDGAEQSQFLTTRITLRDSRSGEHADFINEASDITPDEALGFYREVWSPDQQFLVLPLGRLAGFAACRAEDAIECLKQRRFFDVIRVKENGLEASAWHEFQGWTNPSTLVFGITQDSGSIVFNYDLGARAISSAAKPNGALSAENAAGRLAIAWGRSP